MVATHDEKQGKMKCSNNSEMVTAKEIVLQLSVSVKTVCHYSYFC